jgi:hypothetical protein
VFSESQKHHFNYQEPRPEGRRHKAYPQTTHGKRKMKSPCSTTQEEDERLFLAGEKNFKGEVKAKE